MDNIVAERLLVKMVADVNKYGVSQDGYNEAVALACAALLSDKNNKVTVMRGESERSNEAK